MKYGMSNGLTVGIFKYPFMVNWWPIGSALQGLCSSKALSNIRRIGDQLVQNDDFKFSTHQFINFNHDSPTKISRAMLKKVSNKMIDDIIQRPLTPKGHFLALILRVPTWV